MLGIQNILFDKFQCSKFWDLLLAFTLARAIGSLWSICLRDNIVRLRQLEILATRVDTAELPVPSVSYNGNISLWEAQKTTSLPS